MSLAVGRGQCCMLCCSPLYSPGISIYHAKTFHGQKSFYAKLMEITNYTSSIPQLVSDSMCSVCATMVSQVDQLDYQLNHVVMQVRSLFNKMVLMQSESAGVASRQTARPPHLQHSPQGAGLPGGAPRAVLSSAPADFSSPTEAAKDKMNHFPQPNSFADKKPAKQECDSVRSREVWPQQQHHLQTGTNSSVAAAAGHVQQQQQSTPAGQPPSTVPAAASQEDVVFANIGAFLQGEVRAGAGDDQPDTGAHTTQSVSASPAGGSGVTMAPAPQVSVTGDFTDKFVRGVESDDPYRYQCVLCGKLGDCEQAIRQHVRADHPGADRISFPAEQLPGSCASGSGKRRSTSASPKQAKVPRSIRASSHVMAENIAARIFVCVSCDKAFGCEAFLSRHTAAQNCGRMYGCDFCGREFTRSDKKVRHERSHTGEKPFSCQYCDKTFARRDKCTKHERSHTERLEPVECPRCGEMMAPGGEYAAHRLSCRDDQDGTGSLWQDHQPPAEAPQQPQQLAVDAVEREQLTDAA